MLELRKKVIVLPSITGVTKIIAPPSNLYVNFGDMLDSKFITDKYNYYRTEKKIDLRQINGVANEYVNLGDLVDAEEINHVINNMP